jgi:hypothetical protein
LRWLLALLVLSGLLRAADAPRPSEATVDTEGLHTKPASEPGKAWAEQHFRFHLGPARYVIRYGVLTDPAQPTKVFPSEGYVGMPAPSSSNWYHGGFLFVRVNGQDIGPTRLHAGLVAENGSRAIADLVWDAAPARVRLRFVGLPGDDKLLCEVALEPKEPVRDLRLHLRCYPSFFTAWNKRDGDRKVRTPAATLNQGQRVELPAAQHWYAVYYDTVFDVARGEGEGPCAVLVAPDPVQAVKFDVGSYAVGTDLVCRPDARSVRLAFWDFHQVPNDTALAAFQRSGERWLKELREFDFTPTAVRTFDHKAERDMLAKLTQAPEVRKQLGAKADAFAKRIEGMTKPGPALGILEQAELLGFLAPYREFLWELKLAALLAE